MGPWGSYAQEGPWPLARAAVAAATLRAGVQELAQQWSEDRSAVRRGAGLRSSSPLMDCKGGEVEEGLWGVRTARETCSGARPIRGAGSRCCQRLTFLVTFQGTKRVILASAAPRERPR